MEMKEGSVVRVVEIKTPHPRQFEKVLLVDGALLRAEDVTMVETVEELETFLEMPPLPKEAFDFLNRLNENLVKLTG